MFESDKDRSFVSSVFSSVSGKYDLMNDLMSFGMHRIWKKKLTNLVNISENCKYLDLSCGTGDIAISILKKYQNYIGNATLVDPDAKMLSIAKNKLLDNGIAIENIEFIESTAEEMKFEDKKFDLITLSFGARNFSDLKLGISNCKKALSENGWFYCMEFSPQLNNQTVEKVYNIYLDKFLPKIGKYVAKNEEAYRYLSNSIKSFLTPDQMKDLMKEVGFSFVDNYSISAGSVQIYTSR